MYFSDEIHNDTIKEACFLKAKAFCFTTVEIKEEKKSIGITKTTIENQMTKEDHKNAVFNSKIKY